MFCEQNRIAVRAENLSKIYRLYQKPVHRLKELLLGRNCHTEIVALKDISFSVPVGQAFGIIGDNGAGKSTLLKILSRTLSPSRGNFTVNGKVASLLELGTGFHPEFTGIENIFFYGSLLGIDRDELKSRLDSIIDFSGLGDFVNYPIKTYSSGMYIRLAFSVATILEPDILIIDEALAVGDQSFQKKCLDKMREFKERKKTMIFCSHDLYQVGSFCEKTLWLNKGRGQLIGKTSEVIERYQDFKKNSSKKSRDEVISSEEGKAFLFINDLKVTQSGQNDIHIEFSVELRETENFKGHVGWAIFTADGIQVAFSTSKMSGQNPFSFSALNGENRLNIVIKKLNLIKGTYTVYVGIFDEEAFRPLLIKSKNIRIDTPYKSLNSICHFSHEICYQC